MYCGYSCSWSLSDKRIKALVGSKPEDFPNISRFDASGLLI
ncbi:hypothetical protein RMSM_01442 [Rhodopirellula maiorica SM1]|uniref:Uncharacterized protein n=1 Tax=Rhodopirellula maiorica SM1 TaxID=1265738 RepID=M5RQM9_9BACT|nr:hypothetical protein RMSM_01442 [Rhodopirellula maiorica SM1]